MTSTSIAELQKAGVIIRADEAVAIAQQLIHNPVDGDSPIEPPLGPPSPENVYLDDEGLVVCHACEETPAVSEIAIFLESLLPPGTPGVPWALRNTIARVLLGVDAPPFASIQQFSDVLTRFERGDRTAVVRALVARAQFESNETAPVAIPQGQDEPLDVVPIPPPAERRRGSTIAAGMAAGLCLIGYWMVTHTGSEPPRPAVSIAEPAPDREVAPPPPVLSELPLRPFDRLRSGVPNARFPARWGGSVVPSNVEGRQAQGERVEGPRDAGLVPSTPAAVPVATTRSRIEKPAKPAVKRTVRRAAPAAEVRTTRAKRTGVLDRPPLRWLRKVFTARRDNRR